MVGKSSKDWQKIEEYADRLENFFDRPYIGALVLIIATLSSAYLWLSQSKVLALISFLFGILVIILHIANYIKRKNI